MQEPTITEPKTGEEGQAAVSVVLILSLFLMAILGFAVDLTNVWFHRQAARAAADSACQAGAMDMLAQSAGMSLTRTGFTPGTASDCVGSSSATMCTYAAANGYNGTGLVANTSSNSVSWSFPSSVSGATGSGSNPFMTVTISENVRTYFMAFATAKKYLTINMACTCGVVQAKAAAPMVVLHPTMSGAFTYSGGGALDIVGGPSRGLQVNSSSSTAVAWTASGIINTSNGGPNSTGSDIGIVGGPSTVPTNGSSSGFSGGTTGSWKSSVIAVADPFGSVPVPASVRSMAPSLGTTGQWVAYGTDGCPDTMNRAGQTNSYCREYSPGYYPSGLTLINSYSTIIFQPGVYYLNGSLTAGGSNILRMAKPSGYQRTDGVMFYFLSGSLNLSGCTGCSESGVDNVTTTDLTCDGSAPAAALGMPTTLGGNVLWAQCAANGTYFDNGNDTTDSRGSPGSRGLLLFQDHADTTQPTFSGSGALSFSGTLYFHSTAYGDVLNLSGGASSGTYVLGEIVVDQVNLSGSGAIKLALNPAPTTNVAKVGIIQ